MIQTFGVLRYKPFSKMDMAKNNAIWKINYH